MREPALLAGSLYTLTITDQWRTRDNDRQAMLIPINMPTRISVGKCTPRKIRDRPTKLDQIYTGIPRAGWKYVIRVAIRKAPEV